MVLATAVTVRAARPYPPFPSVHEFAYLPLAWASRDPELFGRDTLLRGFVHHAPAWDIIIAWLDGSSGDALKFWLLTFLLTVAMVAALANIARSAGVSSFLLPVVAALAFCGPVIGLGSNAYDGGLGEGFHARWLSMCVLLWSYEAFLRNRSALAGAWLGAAALCDPVVAVHGAVALSTSAAVANDQRWRRFPMLVGIAALVSLPLSIRIVSSAVGSTSAMARVTPELIRLGYVFRNPLGYLPQLTPATTWWYLGVMTLGGLAAALIPRPGPEQGNMHPLAGLLLGHALIAASGPLFYGDWLPEHWRYVSSLPYRLDLSRTSGLILPLAAVLLIGALELRPSQRKQGSRTHELLWTGLLSVAVTGLVFFVNWIVPLAALVVVGLTAGVLVKSRRTTVTLAAALIGVAALSVARIGRDTKLRVPLSGDEAGLYHWASSTPNQALFIAPPGLLGFRFYARRSLYVDFQLFSPAVPSSTLEWRRRMELVAAPDRLALRSPGWSGVPQWDRTYANRNTPERIESLLRQTGADYLVWDRSGLDLPPYAPIERPEARGLAVAFQNSRFEVYALAKR